MHMDMARYLHSIGGKGDRRTDQSARQQCKEACQARVDENEVKCTTIEHDRQTKVDRCDAAAPAFVSNA